MQILFPLSEAKELIEERASKHFRKRKFKLVTPLPEMLIMEEIESPEAVADNTGKRLRDLIKEAGGEIKAGRPNIETLAKQVSELGIPNEVISRIISNEEE